MNKLIVAIIRRKKYQRTTSIVVSQIMEIEDFFLIFEALCLREESYTNREKYVK